MKEKTSSRLRKQAGRTPAESHERKGLSLPEEVSRQDSGRVMREKRFVLARGSKQVGETLAESHKTNGLSMPEEVSRRDSGRVM